MTPKGLSFLIPFSEVTGSVESGLERTHLLIKNNIENGIFRKKAYLIIVLISNGNDNAYADKSSTGANLHALDYTEKFQKLKRSLSSESLRFISIVPHSESYEKKGCPLEGHQKGFIYQKISQNLYDDLPPVHKDPLGDQNRDSFDLCQLGFEHLFDGANQTIQDIILKHVYNYWPVATTEDPEFDPKNIHVTKSSGDTLAEDPENGFTYFGFRKDHPIRVAPTIGEPFTGHLLKLNGKAQITFPECLKVTTQRPGDFYKYLAIPTNPNLDTVEIKINDKIIPQSDQKGWSFLGFQKSQNIKITSATNFSAHIRPENKTGYIFKLNGDLYYTNEDTISVTFKAKSL